MDILWLIYGLSMDNPFLAWWFGKLSINGTPKGLV